MSKQYFGGKEKKGYSSVLNGPGQGNRCVSTTWAIIVSSKMFQVMHKRGIYKNHPTSNKHTETNVCRFAYVNENDLIDMSNKENEMVDVRQRMMQLTVTE